MVNNPETRVVTGWGLIVPNGQVFWGDYQGHKFDTAQDRSKVLQTLIQAARALDFDVDTFLGHYKWTTRTETITVVAYEPTAVHELTDQAAYDPVGKAGDEFGDQGPGGSDGGAVQQGPVGCSS